ncbi:MAG: hypothetical protein IVW36_05955 [Dehalococcoidia bacterium]|nr:hypothetical protein [Dehalococcoidia bacterium]
MAARRVEATALDLRLLGSMLRGFSPRSWLVALVASAATALAIGLPTRLIANDWFVRMTPTRPQDYAVWAATSLLAGVIAASYLGGGSTSSQYRVMSGGLASYLAVGCPICNKIVVLLLGLSGAMTYFAPLQLYIGIASVLLLAWTLILRARALQLACPVAPVPVQP